MTDQASTEVTRYQVLVVRQGLRACKRGFRLNTAYTPKNLRAMTEKITGHRNFRARDYDGMIAALDQWLAAQEGDSSGGCAHSAAADGVQGG